MYAANAQATGRHEANEVPRGIGLHGWVTVGWTTAGGIAVGGLLVALMTLSGRLSGHGVFMTSSGLFVVGALLGLVHGLVLGFLGRPAGMTRQRAVRDLGLGVVYTAIALPFAWIVAIWMALTLAASYTGNAAPLVGVALGWLAGVTVVALAAVAGWRALRNAYARWPERRLGTLLVGSTFAALLVLFLADRPEIWGLRLRVTETGAVLLAALATLWLAGPMITLALRLTERLPGRPTMATNGGWRVAGDVGLGLVAGLVLGLLAAPFAAPAAAAGTAGALVAGVGQALVDEVLLRLVLVTGAVWLLLRWHRVHPQEAVVVSIAAAALIQVVLYVPGVIAAGFPTLIGAVAFTAMAVALPALVFGVLYWYRGLGTAIVADATAVAAVALLAI